MKKLNLKICIQLGFRPTQNGPGRYRTDTGRHKIVRKDAAPEIKKICDYQSPIFGGKGCVRDIIEQTLKSQDKWFTEHSFVW